MKLSWLSFTLSLFLGASVSFAGDQDSRGASRMGRGILVGLKGGKHIAINQFASTYGLKVGVNYASSGVLHLVNGDDQIDIPTEVLETLSMHPNVAFVERNKVVTLDATPNDPNFNMQWGLNNTGVNAGLAGADIKAPVFWDVITDSSTIAVAIVDSGVNYGHPDLTDNLTVSAGETGNDTENRDRRTNAVDDDNNGLVDDFRGWDFVSSDNDPVDQNGHGTAIAGIIGARGNNGTGIAGVAWRAKIINIRAFDPFGLGDVATVIAGINYAVAQGAKVINCSWGIDADSPALRSAVDAAIAAGAIIVTSAGNNGRDLDVAPRYPGSYRLPGVIVVGSSDSSDRISSFSNYGRLTVDLFAPGSLIYSTNLDGAYGYVSGSSFAAAHMTGALSLMLAREPTLTAAVILQRIRNGADSGGLMSARSKNSGRLNLADSTDINDTTPPAAGVITSVAPQSSTSFRMVINAPTDDGSAGVAKRVEVRTAAAAIDSQATWDAATAVAPSVVQKTATAWTIDGTGVARNGNGFVAFRAVDNNGNLGPISTTSPQFQVKRSQLISHPGDNTTGWTATGGWSVETSGGRTYFTESPNGQYGNSVNTTLSLNAPIVFNYPGPYIMSYDIAYDTEAGFDFCRLEVSADGTTYTELRSYNGVSPYIHEMIDITGSVPANRTIRFRFRFNSDGSITGDGCKIDNLEFLTEEP